jgi:outer membrane immunogenic protein
MPSGVVGGGQLGWNWRFGNVVAGVESDIQASAMRDTACVFACVNAFFVSDGVVEQKLAWFGTTRGRLGYVVGDSGALYYVTGGLAYGKTETSITHVQGTVFPPFSLTASQTRTGWTLGGGVEVPVWGNWRVKAEYLYIDLGSQSFAFIPQPFSNVGVTTAYHENIFRVGANYAFDWGAPAYAR